MPAARRLAAQIVAIPRHALAQAPAARPGLHREAALAEIGNGARRNADELAEFGGGHGLVVILHGMSLKSAQADMEARFFSIAASGTPRGSAPPICLSRRKDPPRSRIQIVIARQRQLYSITASARASNVCGMVRPSAFAVLRLITNSILVGCSIGRSAGLAPLRIFST